MLSWGYGHPQQGPRLQWGLCTLEHPAAQPRGRPQGKASLGFPRLRAPQPSRSLTAPRTYLRDLSPSPHSPSHPLSVSSPTFSDIAGSRGQWPPYLHVRPSAWPLHLDISQASQEEVYAGITSALSFVTLLPARCSASSVSGPTTHPVISQ